MQRRLIYFQKFHMMDSMLVSFYVRIVINLTTTAQLQLYTLDIYEWKCLIHTNIIYFSIDFLLNVYENDKLSLIFRIEEIYHNKFDLFSVNNELSVLKCLILKV